MYLTQLLDMKDAFRDNWNLENQIACRLYQLTLQFQPGPHLLIGKFKALITTDDSVLIIFPSGIQPEGWGLFF